MSRSVKATLSHGFNKDSRRWKIALEANVKMTEAEWEAFLRDLDAFLRVKYPKLRMSGD
jgi:hypothetical protein